MLFSMAEISKVVMLGYVLVTDFEKASHLCTCMDCCSTTASVDEADMCVVDFGKKSHESSEEPPSQKEKSSFCSCSADTATSAPIAMINTLDKAAMLNPVQVLIPNQDKKPFCARIDETLEPDTDDIFHPPKA